MKSHTETEPICCPQFDPEPWDDKLFQWEEKKFIKERVCTLFYMPINFGRVMKRLDRKIREAGANVPDNLGLSDHTSKWNMDILIAVDKDIPGEKNTTLTGKFYSRVYEGPYRDTGKWSKEFQSQAKSKGYDIKKWYMWYTTCPKCAKKYGKNYVSIIALVE